VRRATLLLLPLVLAFPGTVRGQAKPCCDLPAAVAWSGPAGTMALEDLAAYCAPVVWFSPDEPLLEGTAGLDIRMPARFPFEDSTDAPVVYYRLRTLLTREGDVERPAYQDDPADRGRSLIDLSRVSGMDLDYFFYYPREAGLGSHRHDVEAVQMKIAVVRATEFRKPPEYGPCDACEVAVVITRVIGKAHGLLWYDNTLQVSIEEQDLMLPIHVLVEEGKHASCPDRNGDGAYTPGYDVTLRVNDAWGIRDIMSSGALFTGGYQAWFAKPRSEEHRVFPPLPPDSPARDRHTRRGIYAPGNVVYELRPFPHPDRASDDLPLVPFIADKGDPDWPELVGVADFERVVGWIREEGFVKSLAVAYYQDGDGGVALTFPLLVVRNVNEPLTGGWLLNRVYLKDKRLGDVGWNILYTPSASRWVDGYVSAGLEWDEERTGGTPELVSETGIKFRVNMLHSPAKFLTAITDFWGFRVGVKNYGMFDFEHIGYVFEVGAGTW
jgi:hypothetical protein